jgi:DNA-binding transcriptional LysR family regulator
MWDLTDLQIFRAVVEEGGINLAARKLHRVPSRSPCGSKQLEASTGTQLFFRSKQRLHLSPSGECCSRTAQLRGCRTRRKRAGRLAPRGVLRQVRSKYGRPSPGVLPHFTRRIGRSGRLITGTNDAWAAATLDQPVALLSRRFRRIARCPCPLHEQPHIIARSSAHRRSRDVVGDSVIAFPNGCAYRRRLHRWRARRAPRHRVLDLTPTMHRPASLRHGSR